MDDEICGRCLVNVDARSSIAAVKEGYLEQARDRDPRRLKAWAEEKAYGDGCHFQVDATGDRFIAISTWHGDPVCSYHLWQLAEAEMRNGYRPGRFLALLTINECLSRSKLRGHRISWPIFRPLRTSVLTWRARSAMARLSCGESRAACQWAGSSSGMLNSPGTAQPPVILAPSRWPQPAARCTRPARRRPVPGRL